MIGLPVHEVAGFARGQRLRQVTCEKCAREYWYFVERRGIGKSSHVALTSAVATRDRANAAALRDLERRLAAASDLVPCPYCHWISEEAIAELRKSTFTGAGRLFCLIWVIAILAFFAVAMTALNGPQVSESAALTLGAVVSGSLFIAAFIVFPMRGLLRARIDPNYAFPRPPQVQAFTPPAMVLSRDPAKGVACLKLVEVTYERAGKPYDGWAILRPARLEIPYICCVCLGHALKVFRFPVPLEFAREEIELRICKSCQRASNRVWWKMTGVTIASGVGVAAAVLFIWGRPHGTAAFVSAFWWTLILHTFLEFTIVKPYRFAVVNKHYGSIRVKARNPQFTQLLIDQQRRLDEYFAANVSVGTVDAI